MNTRHETFSVGDMPRIEVRVVAGEVSITSGEPGSVDVALSGPERALERFVIEQRGDAVVIEPRTSEGRRGASVDVALVVPDDARVSVRSMSADIVATGTIAELEVKTASGDVRVGTVEGDVTIKGASADVRVDRVTGVFTLAGASGDVRIGEALGPVDCLTASGDARIDHASGSCTIKSASGDVYVGRLSADSLRVKSMSGDVRIGIPAGRTLDVDIQTLSGEIYNDLAASDAPRSGRSQISVQSLSGDIRLAPA